MMDRRTKAIAAFAFALGFVVHLGASRFSAVPSDDKADVSQHWKLVNGYNEYMRDPDNYRVNAHSGFSGAEIPYDPEPSLAALVAAGEIEHVDLVFPSVPSTSEAHRYWMEFIDERQDTILYAIGNIEYVDYKTSGEPVLHLELYFKRNATSDVQQLIRELEALPARQGQITNR
jgi:hypothetical protein